MTIVDLEGIPEAPMPGPLVHVEHRPGQSFKMTRKEAERYVKEHPGTRIVEDAGMAEPESPDTKMVERAPENKAKSMPKGKAT